MNRKESIELKSRIYSILAFLLLIAAYVFVWYAYANTPERDEWPDLPDTDQIAHRQLI